MALYYLDVDDEITSAAARIRDSSDNRIALVLSGGSRVATSRINFRLLAREARHRNKRLAIIAADASVQSIVRSAELPVYASVGDYEQAEAAIAGSLAGGSSGSVSDALDELALTVGPGVANGRTGRTGVTRVPGGPCSANLTLGRPHVPRLLAIGIAVLVVAAVATAGIFLFPSATVILTLRAVPVGPMTVSVNVARSGAAANDQAGTVPGLTKAFPVEASGTYDATGQNVVDTPATGTVTFTSINTVSSVPVIVGTQVGTAGGIEFATTATVNVPRATVSGDKITRGAVDAPVQAMTKGLDRR